MSTLEVNKITPSTGTSITLGDSGDTFTLPSGVTLTNNGTASGFGKIGQVVSSTYSTNTQTTSSTFADTGHSASITPSSTSSKILIMLTYKFGVQRPSNGNKDAGYGIRLLRGSSTNVVTWDEGGTGAYYNFRDNTNVQDQRMVNSLSWIDSPSSTSSQTYKIQHNTYSPSGTVGRYARDSAECILILMEVLA